MIEQNIKRINFRGFFKRYGLYFAVGLCVLFFATLIVIASITSEIQKKDPVVPTNNEVKVQFSNPLLNATLYKDFNSENLVFNSTLNQWEGHFCMDLVATTSTEVLAIYDGVVSEVYSNYLEGNVVKVKHDNGLVSKYASLGSDLAVKVGDNVLSGQKLGTASNTANREQNIGNYLQLTVFDDNGNKIDPSNYLTITNK